MRISSALAITGLASGFVLGMAAPAMAHDTKAADGISVDAIKTAATQRALARVRDTFSPAPAQASERNYGGRPMHPTVQLNCSVHHGTTLVDLSFLAANFCNVVGGNQSGGLGIDTVNILP